MLGALLLLFGCQLLGEVLRSLTRVPVPGPVIGMVILAAILCCRRSSPAETAQGSALDDLAGHLIGNLGLLFVPAGVGVVAHLGLLQTQLLPISVALVTSTLIGLTTTALVLHLSLKSSRGRQSNVGKSGMDPK